jgi:hypothetical protein
MKRLFSLLAILLPLAAAAQQLPQFSETQFEGWTYNNPNVPLDGERIATGKIVLYKDSQGRVLTLTSPDFPCQGIDTIKATVDWYTPTFNSSSFDLNKATLTMAIDNLDGTPLDSVTVTTPRKASKHTLSLSLPMPQGLTAARLRFLSWTGDYISSGAVRGIVLEAAGSSPQQVIYGDADGDGRIGISDVTCLIDYLLSGNTPINLANADVNRDGGITIADVTALIDQLLSGN